MKKDISIMSKFTPGGTATYLTSALLPDKDVLNNVHVRLQ
jgi:hypothetical protein